MKLKFQIIATTVALLFFVSCNHDESQVPQAGQVAFSFNKQSSDGVTGGRTQVQATPAFVNYTLKKGDGSTLNDKIELIEFNGDFLTSPQQLPTGSYTLEQFLILDANNQTIYAAPLLGSELADLVEHPLPMAFDITAEQTTNVVPEVLAVEDHTPVVEKFDFSVTSTIADNDPHPSIDYTLEIIGKDAALGNVQWTKTIAMSATGAIHIPAKYNHYTFKAIKTGYIAHVQHFLKADLSQEDQLSFEFIPESLVGFHVVSNQSIKYYTSKDRCKYYGRMDLPEGYVAYTRFIDRSASAPNSYPLTGYTYRECFGLPDQSEGTQLCRNNVNLFDNVPFGLAQDHCALVDLSLSTSAKTMDDVIFTSYAYLDVLIPGNTQSSFIDFYNWWHQGNSNAH